MKRDNISKTFFNPEEIAAAIAAAPDQVFTDEDSPRTKPGDWDNAITSNSLEELQAKLAERRGRGPNKQPTKQQVAIRYSPEVLAYFKATGAGWQTRIDEVLQDYVKEHRAA